MYNAIVRLHVHVVLEQLAPYVDHIATIMWNGFYYDYPLKYCLAVNALV